MANITRMQLLRGDIKGEKKPFRPPWSIPENFFVDYCTRCDKCIDACFDELIVKGRGGYPQMDFTKGGCDFCEDCLNVCETSALKKIPVEKTTSTNQTYSKDNTEDTSESVNDYAYIDDSENDQDEEHKADSNAYLPPWYIKASIDLTNCLSMNATICRSCGESCEDEVIEFNLQLGGIAEPILNFERCTGCGSCFSVCPVQLVKLESVVS